MQQRSISLDILKLTLSVIVIMAHMYPLFDLSSAVGWYIVNGLTRIVVPSFLIINGYFLASKLSDTATIKKYLIHLIIVYTVWSIFYMPSYITWESYANIIIFYLTGYHHLWYLPALIVGVIILFILKNWTPINDTVLLVLAVLLYIIGNQVNMFKTADFISRNGLFYGFTFITFGYLIKKYKVQDYIKTWHLIVALLAAVVFMYLETTYYYNLDLEINLFLVSLLIGPASILLCLRHPLSINQSVFTYYLGYIPTGIYYIHLYFVYKFYSIDYNIYNVPIVFLASLLAIIPLIFINKKLKIFF